MIDYTKSSAVGSQKSYDAGLREYMLRVYNYMAIGLVLTGIMAFATISFEPLARLMFNISEHGQFMGNTGFGVLVMLAPLGIVVYFQMQIGRMSVEKASTLFWVFSGLMGMSLSSVALVYTGESIARTFFISASVFAAMSLYGYTTQKDLTSFGSFISSKILDVISNCEIVLFNSSFR